MLDFWTMFKDYLPILTGVFTLTSAGLFGLLIADLNRLKGTTSVKQLDELLNLYKNLQSSNLLTDEDHKRFKIEIRNLKNEILNDAEKYQNSDLKGKEAAERFVDTFIFVLVICGVEVGLYWGIIDSLSKQQYWQLIVVAIITLSACALCVFLFKKLYRLYKSIQSFFAKQVIKLRYKYKNRNNHLQ